ncbi:MAG: alpha-hydroxy-acid oxidizing protein [Clostridiales Family XIII bacterium]|jgi:isopentenyl diphosphate isomerase/L-lactate dehydrogenase-like FMN-dependent dehydrogenase|nr:alpha-hydroxy-acid oxidizing protein [Clostridiales Family XIII bacterium]
MSGNKQIRNSALLTRAYLDSLQVELRTVDSNVASTKICLYGESFNTPVMMAPLSGLDNIRPNGAVDAAKGAAAAGAVSWTGIGDMKELESLIATGAKVIKIIKPYSDHDVIFEKIEHAEKSGVFALGMDTDFFYGPMGKRGFAMDKPVSPKTLDDIKKFIRATKLPFILKGILSIHDTVKALEAGAGGIVVSHHGGAVLDYAVPPVRILPEIAKIVDGKIPIFVDSGITRGMDAFKALALGANGVLVGRAVIEGLTAAGAEGVQQVLDGMTEELRFAMSLTCSADPSRIDPSVIR